MCMYECLHICVPHAMEVRRVLDLVKLELQNMWKLRAESGSSIRAVSSLVFSILTSLSFFNIKGEI